MSSMMRFERNLGFLSDDEQTMLEHTSVAIAGVGGDGGLLAIQLARLGVGEFRLADPDTFEIENINRQAVCTDKTIGVNKAEAVGGYLLDINPNAKVSIYSDGATKENVTDFMGGANLLVDETEFTKHQIGVMLAREARKRKIPNLTAFNIGFAAIVTTFHPEGLTLESRLGFKEDQDIDEIAQIEVPIGKWLPYLPAYGDLATLKKVASGEKSAPSIAPGVAIAAGTGATQALLNIVDRKNHRPSPVYAPRALVVDVMSLKAKVIRYNRYSYYKHAVTMLGRNALRLNPRASY